MALAEEQWPNPFAYPFTKDAIRAQNGRAARGLLDDHYGFRMQFVTQSDDNRAVAATIQRGMSLSDISDDPETKFFSRFSFVLKLL